MIVDDTRRSKKKTEIQTKTETAVLYKNGFCSLIRFE